MANFRRGLKVELPSYDYLRGRLNAEALLSTLGIEVSSRRGKQYMACCPFHDERSPSWGFNEEKLLHNCFSCGTSGNVVDLVTRILGVDEAEAFRILEQHSSVTDSSTDDLLDRVQRIMHPVEDDEPMPELPDPKYDKIHPYLYERGITKEVAEEMRVGFDEEHCSIALPHWFMGKLVGIQHRHLAEVNGKYLCPVCPASRKYSNTDNFPKVNTLYGYDQMKNYCRENNLSEVILVESPFTVLYLKSHGIHNVVATFGMFSREQSMLLLPFETVFLWPDNDETGRANVEKAIGFLKRFTTLKIIPAVPGEKSDAANVAPEDLSKYLQNAYLASFYPMRGLQEITEFGH
jgi:DNA primase